MSDDPGARIERLLSEVKELAPPPAVERVEALVGELVTLYGSGLEKIFATLDDSAKAKASADPLVASLLILHGLYRPLDERIAEALGRIHDTLARGSSHPPTIEFTGLEERQGNLLGLFKVTGANVGGATIKRAIEEAMKDAGPELAGIEVEGVVDEGLVQISLHRPQIAASP